jgi:hypothetical protein
MTTTTTSPRLKPQQGVPQLRKVIAVKPDGTVRTVLSRPA